MPSAKDILVLTTSTAENNTVKQYLKPVSAHVVAGTNIFNDFLAAVSDVFGGRSKTYQKQLASLYDEAVETLKNNAYQLGANCIVGLTIDMDEISGTGKSMFMITAVGTAVILENHSTREAEADETEVKAERIPVRLIKLSRQKNEIITQADAGSLNLTGDVWDFITRHKVAQILPYVVNNLKASVSKNSDLPDYRRLEYIYASTAEYIDVLAPSKKIPFLYDQIIAEQNPAALEKLYHLVSDLSLLDIDIVLQTIKNGSFVAQKRVLYTLMYDKETYTRGDVEKLSALKELIDSGFYDRGKRSSKKQLLSSKEKEIWTCECGKVNDIEQLCSGCGNDIYGFSEDDVNPTYAAALIDEKIALVTKYLS